MKKIALAFVLLLCILCGCDDIKKEENKCLYNEMYWGMDREYIIKEKGEPFSYYPNSTLKYNEYFMGNSCEVNYFFDNNKLNMIKVGGKTVLKYNDIKDMFIDGYGDTKKEEMGLDEKDFIADWQVGNTTIQLVVNENIDTYIVTYALKVE